MDLFDFVRAAPPPLSVRESEGESTAAAESTATVEKTETDSELKSKRCSLSPVPISPIFFNAEDTEVELTIDQSPLLPPTTVNTPAEEKNNFSASKAADNLKSKQPPAPVDSDIEDNKELNDNNDDDDDEGELEQMHTLKTKAQQKMFLPLLTKEQLSTLSKHCIKPCIVRIQRLKLAQIERLTTYIPRTANKRGRPRKSDASWADELFTTPPKQQKPSPSKSHIKEPWVQNGSKQKTSKLLGRAHTPPPNLKRSPKGVRFNIVSKELIKRYGSRFFNCFVKLKRLKDFTPKRTNRKSKSKLSVSFSEAVEILGSKPRKSSSISGNFSGHRLQSQLSDSVPTRLQRVDATGNVLEDIALTPHIVASSSSNSGSSSTTTSSKSKRGRPPNSKRRTAKLKRPSIRVPVTGLASLRLDDSQSEEADNEVGEEYIVPNEVPVSQTTGVRQSGTSTPVKRLTVTTTVSDEEDVPEKKMKTDSEQKDGTSAEETAAPDTEQAVEPATEQTAAEPAIESTAAKSEAEEKEVDQSTEEAVGDQVAESTTAHSQLKPKAITEELQEVKLEPQMETEQAQEQDQEQLETEAILETADLKSSALLTALTDDIITDDILEIQASLEDVRQLHTPPSRQSTPQSIQNSTDRCKRFESPESDSSFKSANEHENVAKVNTATEQTPAITDSEQLTTAAGIALPANTINGTQLGASGSSITRPTYSPIGEILNLDDDELGHIVEHDFQLNNSRHAISRGTLDDIMTVLES